MTQLLAAIGGLIGALVAQDLSAQALHQRPLRLLAGTCPRCGTRRGWPKSRCPRCGRRVSSEAAIAAVGAAMGWGLGLALGPGPILVAYLGFVVLTLALVDTDLRDLRIVDRLNLPGTVLVVAALALASWLDGSAGSLLRALAGGLAYFAGANVVFFVARGKGFGYGDVKLSVQLGVFTAYWSWGTLGWAVLITALAGGAVSLLVLALGALRLVDSSGETAGLRAALKTELPYGPVMVFGAWSAILLAGLGAFPLPT